MMEIRVVKPCLPQPDIKEILRYSGVRGEDEGVRLEIERLLPGLEKAVKPAACYAELSVSLADCEVRLGNIAVRSRSLSKLLSGADRAIIFAVTVGVGLDREIARLGAMSPARTTTSAPLGSRPSRFPCRSDVAIIFITDYASFAKHQFSTRARAAHVASKANDIVLYASIDSY